jgi:hypothetical protein
MQEAFEENTDTLKNLHEEIRGMREDFRILTSGMENHAAREELVFNNLAEKLADLKNALEKLSASNSR